MSRTPPAWFRRRVRAIDRDLDVEWLDREEKWGIVQRLYNTPSIEALCDQVTTDAQTALLADGYQPPRDRLARLLYPFVSDTQLVMRIEEPDGSYRAPDDRTLRVLEEMAWNRRTRNVRDWIEAGALLVYEEQRRREARRRDLWDSIRKDRVYRRCMRDALRGLRPTRSVIVPGKAA